MQNFATITIYQLSRLATAATCSGGTITTPKPKPTDPNIPVNTSDFQTCLPGITANGSAFKIILQLVFGVIGAIAIIYIMYGAFRFVRSQGEPKEITQARQTIIYAILGLVIAITAETIVSFALGKF